MDHPRAFRLMLLASPEPEPTHPGMTIIYLFVDPPAEAAEPEPGSEPDQPPADARGRGRGRDRLWLLPTPTPPEPVDPASLAPLFFPGVPIDAAGERWLTARAHAARAGEPGAVDLLHRALEPRFARWAALRVHRLRDAGPRRDGQPWLLDDLRQEGYFVLRATVESWSGEGSFLPWLLAVAPKRLHNAWRTLARERTPAPVVERAEDDPDLAAVELPGLVERCFAALGPDDAELLRVYLRCEGSPTLTGRRLGLSRGRVQYRLRRILDHLRTLLLVPADPV